MTTTLLKRHNPAADIFVDNIRTYLSIKSAYEQCSPEIREAIDDMTNISADPTSTEEERTRALMTIVEALFPGLTADLLDNCNAVRRSEYAIEYAAEMAREEATFAENVQFFMNQQGMRQEDLAAKSGVGQSAISNMLNRQCRPQRRTIIKLAQALNVKPSDLWPDLKAD